MKKSIFITVRSASTRLPGKASLQILGKPTIRHVIDRVKRARLADSIVLCTTELPEDDALCVLAQEAGIEFFRGSVKDKLERWNGAAQKFGVEFFVTADGDDLFCEPELIDLALAQYARTGCDFLEGKGIICGSFTYGIKTSALREVCQLKDTDDTEMMWVYFTQTDKFTVERLEDVPAVFCREDIRMTLDYPDDFRFFETVIGDLRDELSSRSLREIVAYLDENPEVIAINQYLERQWSQNQQRSTHLILKNEP